MSGSASPMARRAAERYVELVNLGDFEGVISLFDEEAEHCSPAGVVRGRGAIGEFYIGFARPLGATITPLLFVAEDPHSAMEFEATTRAILRHREMPQSTYSR